ncbi:MAG: YdeI/OmpD-associated family protein [Alistipes sp.]|nr:YdeI/OmpD-associated family protein [Alistipes sp.]
MEAKLVLEFSSRNELRDWLASNHDSHREAWVVCNRSGKSDREGLPYLDIVYELLCFGWIDSTRKTHENKKLQRITPRKSGSNWTELNKERCRYLERLGLMTDAGRAVLPDNIDDDEPCMDENILALLQSDKAFADNFAKLPALYKRVRIGNMHLKHSKDPKIYRRRLEKFIDCTRRGVMYGEWNDGGRLLQDLQK